MKILLGLFFLVLSLQSYAQLEKKALVIIDMQPDFTTRLGRDKIPGNGDKVRKLVATQLELIEKAKKANLPIIVVTFKKHGDLEESIEKSLKKYPKKFELEKTTDSMFDDLKVQKDLFSYLKKENVSDLVITGANGGACVFKSIYSSLAYNYNVQAVSDAIADFNFKEFIYPYEYSKNKFYTPKGCKRCGFEEMMSSEVDEKVFGNGSELTVDQSERSSGKALSEQTQMNQSKEASKQ